MVRQYQQNGQKDIPKISKSNIQQLSEKELEDMSILLISIAGADGYISPEEIKTITKLHTKLGINPDNVYHLIHHFRLKEKEMSEDPVTISSPTEKGLVYKIPKPSEEIGFHLDMIKIKKRIKDTQAVSSILSNIFVDTKEINNDTIIDTFCDLDQEHSAILISLKEKEIWPRKEFDMLVNKYGLLPNGVLELLNEKSIEVCDDILCEGDDPIEINIDVLEELIK